MATASASRKFSKDERAILITALYFLAKSQERAARAATGDGVRDAYVVEAGKTKQLLDIVTSSELEL